MKLKLESKEIELADIWFKYLYSDLVRFSLKNGIDTEWKNDTILIPINKQLEFNKMLKSVLHEILIECYIEPSHKERSQNPTRFQDVEFEGKHYALNYRTSIVGIIGYALFYLISQTETNVK